ncbi:MAG: hypothetical protein F4066_07910 [Chloroflexi bacterium]|nr:hypothetical protein [Chloroflexota bacterium]MYF80397.1 hypothetical protein [Chloroflexota bacterium]MYI04771.1 hypothetical protein [Chloroflexota bacterium]
MLILTLLILACLAWLIWEWKSAALVSDRGSARNASAPSTRTVTPVLPTAAALGVDADVAVRINA